MWKSRLLFVFVLLLGVFAIVIYGNPSFGYTILYSALILFVLSIGSIILANVLLKIEQSIERTALSKNDRLKYNISIANKGVVFYSWKNQQFYNEDLLFYNKSDSLPPIRGLGTVDKHVNLQFPYRGEYTIGLNSIVVSDFLGLFTRKLDYKGRMNVLVYPEYDPEFSMTIKTDKWQTAITQSNIDEDYSEVAELREYTPSDSLKKVHWKLSAKRGELLVKEFENYIPSNVVVFLDTREIPTEKKYSAHIEDEMVSYVASAIGYLVRENFSGTFVYGKDSASQLEITQIEEITPVLELLATVKFDEHQEDISYISSIYMQSRYVLFLWSLSDDVYVTLQDLARNSMVIVYYFSCRNIAQPDDIKFRIESLRENGIEVNRINIGL